jgi:hypothetical protein
MEPSHGRLRKTARARKAFAVSTHRARCTSVVAERVKRRNIRLVPKIRTEGMTWAGPARRRARQAVAMSIPQAARRAGQRTCQASQW